MENLKLDSVEAIDKTIQALYSIRASMLAGVSLLEKVKENTWVITDNKYYQIGGESTKRFINLFRHNENINVTAKEFNTNFRLATQPEVVQHIDYLKRKGCGYAKQTDYILEPTQHDKFQEKLKHNVLNNYFEKQMDEIKTIASTPAYDMNGSTTAPADKKILPDFYMVTVKGLQGTKFRHESYEAAEKEAMRLAKSENHRAHIMGVVAIVDPIVDVQLEVTRK